MPDSSELSGGTDQGSAGDNKPSKTRIITILVIIAIIAGFIYAANSGPKSDDATDEQLSTSTDDALVQPADNTNDDSTTGQPGVKTDDKSGRPTTTVDNKPQPVTPPVKVDCVVMGCNNEVCTTPDDPVFTACVVQPQFVCYKTAKCEKQTTGRCGWTQTPELTACLAENSI